MSTSPGNSTPVVVPLIDTLAVEAEKEFWWKYPSKDLPVLGRIKQGDAEGLHDEGDTAQR